MLNISTNIQGLSKLQKQIDFVEKMLNMKTDTNFQKFIQSKCLEAVNKISQERIYLHNTTNTEMRSEYLNNNKIRELKDGFIIYNDTYVTVDNPSYEGGIFSIALAFEYGVGIIGEQNPVIGAWQYDVNGNLVFDENGDYIRGWWISKTKNGSNPYVKESKSGNAVVTQGYQGMEIYRYSAEYIKKNLQKWVEEYYRKEVQ